jgi:hypothetical protein
LAFGHAAIIARIAFSDLGKTAEIGEKMAAKQPKNGENGWKMGENGREIDENGRKNDENGRKMAENGKFCARMPKLDGFFAVGAPENGIYSAIFGENDGSVFLIFGFFAFFCFFFKSVSSFFIDFFFFFLKF